VLIPRKLIDEKNKEIQGQGDHKIKLMEDIKKIKFDVAQSEYQLKRRELVIKDLECKTREV
jgi:septal ring factor EnvC (AmiA/AmiB activator)